MQAWEQFGLLGLIVIGLSGYILRMEVKHKKERDELREIQRKEREEFMSMMQRMFDRTDKREDENNKIHREHINILSGLKTLFENRK